MDLSRGGRAAIDRMIEAYGFTTKQALCDQLGISSSTLANRYLRDTFPADFVIQCALETGVSLRWLTTGEGLKYEDIRSDVISINKKKILDGKLYDAGFLLVDKTLIDADHGNIEAVIHLNNTYFIDINDKKVKDGLWIINIDDTISIKKITKLPKNHIMVSSKENSFECNFSDIVFYGYVVSILRHN